MATFRNSISIVVAACSLIFQLHGVRGVEFLKSMCGVSYPASTTSRIMHGTVAKFGSAPFMAYLIRNQELHCGGTIIHERYILTAAHCIESGITVRVGEYNTDTNPDCLGNTCFPKYEDFQIKAVLRNRNYVARDFVNDIALLKLTRDIQFNLHIQPICLLLNPALVPNRRQWQAFGWGKTQRGVSSSVLKTTMLDHYPNSHCAQRLNVQLTNNQACLGHQQTDTCAGDSGGPLVIQINVTGVIRYLQLGIVSFGDELCQSPGVYTYVPNYIGWIRNVIRTLG
ncbi:melanization protease 1-like [Drosophila serrata]|uniref:melanization protease 1-like n=1 Tax=Drosophila serrata TaxID=7274 RepID=UPI000A1D2137|nr:melanization protease 1-like [Drosophila serrata]